MRVYITDKGKRYHSFLECLEKENFTIRDLNDNSIIEFLRFGGLFFDDTFLNGVKKVYSCQKLTLDPNIGFKEIETPEFLDLREEHFPSPENIFLEFFSERASFLKEKKLSLDLTGGIDSRLLATILHDLNIPFHAVYSMDAGSEEEAEIVKKVADTLQCPLQIMKSEPITNRNELEDLFTLSDGYFDVLGLISLSDTQQWRSTSGFDLVINGVGGPLYKDFFWQQDFPFYQKKKSNISKLIRLRMSPLDISDNWLHNRLSKIQSTVDREFEKKLLPFSRSTNSQTYDQVFLNARINEELSVLTSATSRYLDSYAPLLEYKLVQIGYSLPRRKRFFNSFYRDIITRLNPSVARIPTTAGGASISNELHMQLWDFLFYGADKSKKLMKKTIFKRYSKKQSSKEKELIHNEIVSQQVGEAIDILKTAGIFSSQMPTTIEKTPLKLQGRILTLGMLVNKLL